MPDSKRRARRRRKMPGRQSVLDHWRDQLVLFDKYVYDELPPNHNLFCFACGRPEPIQRAHILPIKQGGADHAGNLHLLCPICHAESEELYGEAYWQWFHCVPRGSGLAHYLWQREYFTKHCC